MQIAIITGASSGLGKVFFEKVAERYPQLDEYWVVARPSLSRVLSEMVEEGIIKYSNKKYSKI